MPYNHFTRKLTTEIRTLDKLPEGVFHYHAKRFYGRADLGALELPKFYVGDVMCSILTSLERAKLVLVPFYSDEMESFLRKHDRPIIPWIIVLPTDIWRELTDLYPAEFMRDMIWHSQSVDRQWQSLVMYQHDLPLYVNRRYELPMYPQPNLVVEELWSKPKGAKKDIMKELKQMTDPRRDSVSASSAALPCLHVAERLIRVLSIKGGTIYDPVADKMAIPMVCTAYGMRYYATDPDADNCRLGVGALQYIENTMREDAQNFRRSTHVDLTEALNQAAARFYT